MCQETLQSGWQLFWRDEGSQRTGRQVSHSHLTGSGTPLHGLSEECRAEGVVHQTGLVMQ